MEIAKTVTMISSPASSEDQVYEVKEDTPLFYPLAKRVAAPNVGKKPKSGAEKSHAGQKPKKTKHPSNAIGRPSAASPPTAYALEKPLWVFGTRGKECGGEFMFPYGIAVNNEGNIVIADTSNDRVQVLKKNGVIVRVFGAEGKAPEPKFKFGFQIEQVPKDSGLFDGPCGVTVDKDGHIVVVDSLNDRVQIFSADGKQVLKMFGEEGHEPGEFCEPYGVAVDATGNILVADRYNHKVQVFREDGRFLNSIGGKGSDPGQFLEPCWLAINRAGEIIVADTENHRLQIVGPRGAVRRVIGSHGRGAGPGHFNSPFAVAVDRAGFMYVADSGNHRVQILSEDGDFVRSFGEEGVGEGQFRTPRGVALDSDGNVIVLDTNNNRVQIFAPMIQAAAVRA